MTIREVLDRKKRRVMSVVYVAMGVCAISIAFGRLGLILFLPGFAVAFLSMLYGYLVAYRCPRCAGPWSVLVMNMGRSFFSIDPRIRYCPFCGTDVDAKESAKASADATDRLD